MRRETWWVFGTFCVLGGSGWLLPGVGGWVEVGVLGLVGLGAVLSHGRVGWLSGWELVRLGLGAVLLFAVPEMISRWAGARVSGALGTVVLALVPMLVVMLWSAGDGTEERGLLAPAVVGLSGLLLLLPLDLPASSRSWVALAGLVFAALLVAGMSVAMYRWLQGVALTQAVAIFCLANALVLGVVSAFGKVPMGTTDESVWVAAGVMAISTVLLMVLLRGLEPTRFGARFLVVPLVSIVEGYVLLRPELTLRMGFGVLLLAGGAGWLLVGRQVDEVASLRLR